MKIANPNHGILLASQKTYQTIPMILLLRTIAGRSIWSWHHLWVLVYYNTDNLLGVSKTIGIAMILAHHKYFIPVSKQVKTLHAAAWQQHLVKSSHGHVTSLLAATDRRESRTCPILYLFEYQVPGKLRIPRARKGSPKENPREGVISLEPLSEIR